MAGPRTTGNISTPADPPQKLTLMDAALSDTADQFTSAAPCRAFSFGVAGAIKVTTVGGSVVTIPSGALAVGVQHSLQVLRFWSTGTGSNLQIIAYHD